MNVVLLIIGLALSALYCILYFANSARYRDYIDRVDDSVFVLKDTYVVGLAVIRIFKINTAKTSHKKRQQYAELFTSQFVGFYCLIGAASTISLVLTFLPFAFLFGAIANSVEAAFIIMLLAILMPLYMTSRIDSRVEQRREELLLQYPAALSKMALLINAGMVLRDAWTTVANSGEGVLYTEMKRTAAAIAAGEYEINAYLDFGTACRVNELKKFASIVCQNVEKGNSEFVQVMKQLSAEAWNSKKNIAVSRGKNAETKLIIPIGITFVAILAMVLVPIMSNMNI